MWYNMKYKIVNKSDKLKHLLDLRKFILSMGLIVDDLHVCDDGFIFGVQNQP